MAGLLPATRPLAANYGQALENERAVEDPSRELDAENWNALREDASYAARMTPLLRIQVTYTAGVPACSAVWGPEGTATGDVTVTDNGTGDATVDWTATGVSATDAHAIRRTSTDGTVRSYAFTATSLRVLLFSTAPAAEDVSFTVIVY